MSRFNLFLALWSEAGRRSIELGGETYTLPRCTDEGIEGGLEEPETLVRLAYAAGQEEPEISAAILEDMAAACARGEIVLAILGIVGAVVGAAAGITTAVIADRSQEKADAAAAARQAEQLAYQREQQMLAMQQAALEQAEKTRRLKVCGVVLVLAFLMVLK